LADMPWYHSSIGIDQKGESVDVRIVERYESESDALRDYAEKKVSSLPRYFDKIQSLDVVIEVERGQHRVEMVGHLVNKKTVKAEATTDDMYASVDQAVEKLQRQLVKYKEQLRVERKGGDKGESEQPSEARPRIVTVDSYIRKPMGPEEAVLVLEDSGKDFLVFFHEQDDYPAVVFRRTDGEYGLILPRRS